MPKSRKWVDVLLFWICEAPFSSVYGSIYLLLSIQQKNKYMQLGILSFSKSQLEKKKNSEDTKMK